MKKLGTLLTLFACGGAPAGQEIRIVGPLVIEDSETQLCGPGDLGLTDKLIGIPDATSVIGLGTSPKYYPGEKNSWARAYSIGGVEKDAARMGVATADFWLPPVQSFNVASSAQANVHITVGGPLWPACDADYTGGSDECWFAGTTCTASRNTNVTGVKVCEDWKIELNIDSMNLFSDSRELRREDLHVITTVHEVGHTFGLRHRAGTVMNSGVPLPGYNVTWEEVPRFDACQIATLEDYAVDTSSQVIYLPTPDECL